MSKSIEELNLSLRSFNCLNRAGINTLADLAELIERKGIDALFSIRNMGWKSADEILKSLYTAGYPIYDVISGDLATLRTDPHANSIKIRRYEAMLNEWSQIPPIENGQNLSTEGTSIESLSNIPLHIVKRLSQRGIKTVEELLSRYNSPGDLPLLLKDQWQLLRALDKNGYRFSECDQDRWPDIEDYIAQKRALSYRICELGVPIEIEEKLINSGLTVEKIINSKWHDLQAHLNNREIAVLLYALDELNFRTKDASLKEYPEISDFIVHNVEINITDMGFSPRLYHALHDRSLDTLLSITKCTRSQLLENKVIGATLLKELTQALLILHTHLNGDEIYTCSKCSELFAGPIAQTKEHYCRNCLDKLERINRIKDCAVTLDGPDYGSYTDGTRGFTIFATIHNRTKKIAKIGLKEFMLFCDGRQWASTSNLTGYPFSVEHILPESSKTAAKIWSGSYWKEKRLSDGDYITLSITANGKTLSYKFVLKREKFELEDYYAY